MVVSLKCRKVLCVLYSWLLFLSGVVLICFALVLAFRIFHYNEYVPLDFYSPCMILCLLGVVHLLLTWLGVNGPTREHDFHVLSFIVITGALFFIEISTGAWTIVLWNKAEKLLNEYVNQNYNNIVLLNRLEREYECCGFHGYTDYNKTGSVPLQCCSTDKNGSACLIIQRGCREPLTEHLEWLILQSMITGFSAALYQIFGFVIFIYFYKFLKLERLNRSTLRRSRMHSLRRQMSHAGVDPTTHI